jgi:riboflavin synthase
MFTGIIESTGEIREIQNGAGNRSFWIASPLSAGLRPDQSLSHDGACLTVESVAEGMHRVTAVPETLEKTCLGSWKPGYRVNLERAMMAETRLDGHFVQGHVDCRGICTGRKDLGGSWEFRVEFPKSFAQLVVEKGSICLNGVSLTAHTVRRKSLRVAIIPFTFEHTNLAQLFPGMPLNIEFDLIGKYIARICQLQDR